MADELVLGPMQKDIERAFSEPEAKYQVLTRPPKLMKAKVTKD